MAEKPKKTVLISKPFQWIFGIFLLAFLIWFIIAIMAP